jgi:phage terminase large subunit GpA-like protein
MRVEITVLGHGHFGELWFIDYKVIAGDFQYDQVRADLDEYLMDSVFIRDDGFKMKIFGTGIDTGGHRTKAVYDYVKSRLPNKIFGMKGSSTPNAPVVNKQIGQLTLHDKNLFLIGTTTIKDDFYGRLGVTDPGPNYVHFPKKDIFDKRFFNMLTAEKRDDKGKYVKIRSRNEALDVTVYAIAVLTILDLNIHDLRRPILYIGEMQQAVQQTKKKDTYERPSYLDEF